MDTIRGHNTHHQHTSASFYNITCCLQTCIYLHTGSIEQKPLVKKEQFIWLNLSGVEMWCWCDNIMLTWTLSSNISNHKRGAAPIINLDYSLISGPNAPCNLQRKEAIICRKRENFQNSKSACFDLEYS